MRNAWKKTNISDGYDNNKIKKDHQQQEDLEASNIIVEQFVGICYTFDTETCAI